MKHKDKVIDLNIFVGIIALVDVIAWIVGVIAWIVGIIHLFTAVAS